MTLNIITLPGYIPATQYNDYEKFMVFTIQYYWDWQRFKSPMFQMIEHNIVDVKI
jgi:hypothetical protein